MTATREPAPPQPAAVGSPPAPVAVTPAPGPEISDAATELGAAFKGLMGAFRRLRGRETHNPHGLTDAQYTLLLGLRGHEALASRELACLAGLSAASATEMLEGLAQAGLVTRVRSDQDRRVVLTSLTERGQALLEEHHAQYAPRWNAAVSEFSDEELRSAARVLHSLGTMFDEIAREP